MIVSNTIEFLTHNELNKIRYDECVIRAENSLVYARSFYLDSLCSSWSALVATDYSWVMPITEKKKLGISYLYQPPFTQQLGVFNLPGVVVPFDDVMKFLKKKYSFWEVNFNYKMQFLNSDDSIELQRGTNFILPLNTSYNAISNNYNKDLTKNIKRSSKQKLTYSVSNNYLQAIEQYIHHYSNRIPHITISDYNNFKHLCAVVYKEGMLVCREAVNEQGELMSVALLINDGKRLYNLMNTTTASGRKVAANHFLLDSIIKEFAGQHLLLDFEGSDLEGVKTFYENFGAINQPYYMAKYNNLPWPISLLK